MATELTLSVTHFKSHSLKLLDELARGRLGRINVTKRGRPLAVVTAAEAEGASFDSLYGSMRGRSRAREAVDLTQPIYDGPPPRDDLSAASDAAA